jgi:hypothetical protein
MAKVFYTERDIEDMARQGVTSLDLDDNIVVTDLAREKARRLGLTLVSELDRQRAARAANTAAPAPVSPPQPAPPAAMPAAPRPAISAPQSSAPAAAADDLEARVYSAVKRKLNGQVDDALLRTIVQRVLKSLGR